MDNKMGMRRPLFGGLNSSAEFVTLGHPDKACDQIAGRILDNALKLNWNAKVAIEMVACNGKVVIGGEVSPDVHYAINFEQAAVDVFTQMGYNVPPFQITRDHVSSIVNRQSEDILQGVIGERQVSDAEKSSQMNAGDQGVMNGYAIYAPERNYMPAAFWYAQQLALRLWDVTRERIIPDLYADGKTQVIIRNGKISHVTIAIHHGMKWHTDPDEPSKLRRPIYNHVLRPVVGELGDNFIVNGTGNFENGSIWADSAEVGRKIVIDQMGPDIPVGGGTMNGKDPSKVDLTGAVMARYIAKQIVAHRLADEALVQYAFTIGQSEPDALIIFAPGWKLSQKPEDWCREHFPLTVRGMIDKLELNTPVGWSYEEAAQFGFYGHSRFPWERIEELK